MPKKYEAPEDWVPKVGEMVYTIDHFEIYVGGPYKVERITPKGAVRVRFNETKGGTGLYKLGWTKGDYRQSNGGKVTTWSHIVPVSVVKTLDK